MAYITKKFKKFILHPVLYTRSQKGYRRKVGAPPPSALFARQSFNGAQIGERKMRKPHFLTKSKKAKPKRIYYTSLFCSCGIGEYYLKQLGLYPGVAVELNPERAKFFQEMYPECHVIQGDFWDLAVFSEAVEWHKRMNCVGTMCSCPCQEYSNANAFKDPTNARGQLFLQELNFVRATPNEWVFNENVVQMLTLKSVGGIVVGELSNKDCVQWALNTLMLECKPVGILAVVKTVLELSLQQAVISLGSFQLQPVNM